MKILQSCTLLQACEYLAFDWVPFSDDDEQLCSEERWRPYLKYGNNGKPEEINRIRRQLTRAKEQLILLFDRGLQCNSNGTPIQFPKLQRNVANNTNINMGLGILLENHFFDAPIEPPYVVIQDFTGQNPNKYFDNISIDFSELKKIHEQESKISDTFRLFVDKGHLYCQKNDEPPIQLKKRPMRGTADNYSILKFIINNPNKTLSEADIVSGTGIKFEYGNGIRNKLQTLFKGIPQVEKAFFPILSAQQVHFRQNVTNHDLIKNNIQPPI